MKAGRKLDALIAEKVMDCTDVKFEANTYGGFADGFNPKRPEMGISHLPHYSTEISAAWEIMQTPYFDAWMVGKNALGHWQVYNPYECVTVSTGDSAPHAICLAVLHAVRIDPDKL